MSHLFIITVPAESSIALRSGVQLTEPESITQAGVQNECQHNPKSTISPSKKNGKLSPLTHTVDKFNWKWVFIYNLKVRTLIVTKKRKKQQDDWSSKREINSDSQSNNSSGQTTQSNDSIETGRYGGQRLMHHDDQDIIPSDANELPEPAKGDSVASYII